MRNTGGGLQDALSMVALFESVGVEFFDLTHTNIDQEKRGFRPKQGREAIRTSLPFLVPSAARRQNNVILRPHDPPAVLLIQLDDLKTPEALERVSPAAFMVLATSPGNHQAWVALEAADIADRKDFARRVRKAAGADPTASGATRVAGTANYKRKYEPEFPIVTVMAAQPGNIVQPAVLQGRGLVAPPEEVRAQTITRLTTTRRARGKWPSYRHSLAHASRAHDAERPDISRVDFTWCMTAIDWGHSIEDTAGRLMEESEKARENGPQYAMTTARNAASAVERRRGRALAEPSF